MTYCFTSESLFLFPTRPLLMCVLSKETGPICSITHHFIKGSILAANVARAATALTSADADALAHPTTPSSEQQQLKSQVGRERPLQPELELHPNAPPATTTAGQAPAPLPAHTPAHTHDSHTDLVPTPFPTHQAVPAPITVERVSIDQRSHSPSIPSPSPTSTAAPADASGAAAAAAAPTDASGAVAAAVGCWVVLDGLSNAAMNGQTGQITSTLNARGRCNVTMDGDAQRTVSIRPANMLVVDRVEENAFGKAANGANLGTPAAPASPAAPNAPSVPGIHTAPAASASPVTRRPATATATGAKGGGGVGRAANSGKGYDVCNRCNADGSMCAGCGSEPGFNGDDYVSENAVNDDGVFDDTPADMAGGHLPFVRPSDKAIAASFDAGDYGKTTELVRLQQLTPELFHQAIM